MERYMKMKKEELAALAREAGVKGRSRMTKAQLAAALAALSLVVEGGATGPGASVLHLSQEPAAPVPSRPEAPELPLFLEEVRFCLLPQEPRKAFAYWELKSDPSGGLLLRVWSAPAGETVLEQTVSGRLGSFYIHLPASGMEIESELFWQGPEGPVSVARSNRIRLPDDSPSEEMDTLWMTRRREYEEIYRLSGGALESGARKSVYGAGKVPGAPSSSWKGPGGQNR